MLSEGRFIKAPSSEEESVEKADQIARKWNFENCIGAAQFNVSDLCNVVPDTL